MSLFVAVPLPAKLQDHLSRYASEVARIAPEARLVPARNWHLTLAFLGSDTSDVAVRRASEALGKLQEKDFLFDIAGIGIFPGRGPQAGFCTVWARVEEVHRMRECHTRLRELLEHEGFRLDHRIFRAHVTLARKASIAHGAELSELEFEKPSFYANAEKVCLMKTVPASDGGVVYETLATQQLLEAPDE